MIKTRKVHPKTLTQKTMYKTTDMITLVTQIKWSTETNEINNRYLRDYDNMHRQMEHRQIDEYYIAQRQIHSAIMDTPEKTVYNRQYIDNILLLKQLQL